jgi:AraC family transcriptional regulator
MQAFDAGAVGSPTRSSRVVHRGPGFELGEFLCHPDDPTWGTQNEIGDRYHLVFPQTAVGISLRSEEVIADPNVVMLYNAGDTYRRSVVDPTGDHCYYASLDESTLLRFLGRTEGPVEFPAVCAPVDGRAYALQWRTLETLKDDPSSTRVSDDGIEGLLGSIVRRAFDRPPSRSRTSELVEAAKRVLNECLDDRLSLGDIAQRVHISPFHLTRLFHARTGLPLHRYRLELRLRRSLGRVKNHEESLRGIAQSLGFASHSHFTARFRATFGFTPSEWRRGIDPCCIYTSWSGSTNTLV